MAATGDVYLVTGACGFSGQHLVTALCDAGHVVRAADVVRREGLDERAEFVRCDVTSHEDVAAAVAGVTAVLHLGAIVPFNLPSAVSAAALQAVNVGGTETLVTAAKAAGVRRFLLASSTGVVFGGDRDISGEDEGAPVPQTHNDAYSRSKALAEGAVLAAGTADFAVVALRPNGIWGPGEAHHIPKLLSVAVAGLSGTAFGVTGDTDFTHVDSLVDAFLAADGALSDPARRDAVNGRAFFVTDGRPLCTLEFFTPLLTGLGFPAPFWMQWLTAKAQVAPRAVLADADTWDALSLATSDPTLRVPDEVMVPVAAVMQGGAAALHAVAGVNVEPFLTLADMRKLSRDNYYCSDAAKDALGWRPRRSFEANMLTLIAHYRAADYDGRVLSPHTGVWAGVLLGLGATFVLAWDWGGAATALSATITAAAEDGGGFASGLVSAGAALTGETAWGGTVLHSTVPRVLQGIAWGAVVAHVGQAAVAAVAAGRNRRNVVGWVTQTALLGFPSLGHLLASIAAGRATFAGAVPMQAPLPRRDGVGGSNPLRTGVEGLGVPGEKEGNVAPTLPSVGEGPGGALLVAPVVTAEEAAVWKAHFLTAQAGLWWLPLVSVPVFLLAAFLAWFLLCLSPP